MARGSSVNQGRDTFGDRKVGDSTLGRHDPDAVPTRQWDAFAREQFPEGDAPPTPSRQDRVRGTTRIGG